MTVAAAALLAFFLAISPASAQITFGTLSNFDCFNDTGGDTNGFEIELDGVSSADVTYTFGAPYERYGNPTLVDFAGGVYVRYESQYDPVTKTFLQATPLAPSPITPTAGHACYNGGPIGNYLTSGCEHFGIGLNKNPANTVYRWLVGDPATGALQPAGTKVSIPAPVWNVTPPVVPGNPPVVKAAIQAPPIEPGGQFGEAQWVKVFVTETPNQAVLHHLLTDDPAVPQEQAEVEIEWVLLQTDSGNPNGANNELAQEGELGAGNESITRRYEFYKYTGKFDVDGQALCEDPILGLQADCGDPDANGLRGVGDYIGAQMAALNLNPPAPPTVSVSMAGAGSGTVTSTPPGIDCGATCSALFAAGDLITLTAAPDAGSFFAGWGGDCVGTNVGTALTPSGDASCTATFELIAHSADLSLSAKQSPAKAHMGKRVRYAMKVKNLGPMTASAAVLTADISGAADLASIKAPKSCTVLGGSITCPLGDLKKKKAVTRLISVVPSAAGTVNVTASATSSILDPVSANNAAAVDTVVP
jgi:Domain of unknown function DUF11/Divergent InlB B-repeat domain